MYKLRLGLNTETPLSGGMLVNADVGGRGGGELQRRGADLGQIGLRRGRVRRALGQLGKDVKLIGRPAEDRRAVPPTYFP